MDNIKRGEMFYISRGGASYSGSEQHSDRPAVVVSNDKNNENSNVVEVVYMTTQPKTDLPTHVTVRSTGRPTRNAMILKVLNEMTKGKEVTVENLDSLKDIFNEQLDPAIAESSIVITNQSGFNYLDKLKDKDGNYILQKDPTQQTKGKMLFGEYRIVKLSKKTLKSTPIMNSDGHTIDGYKHPVFCGDLKEAITLFDRNVLTIDLNDKGAGLWDKDMTGLKVRDRFDVQAVDKDAVIKGEITEIVNG